MENCNFESTTGPVSVVDGEKTLLDETVTDNVREAMQQLSVNNTEVSKEEISPKNKTEACIADETKFLPVIAKYLSIVVNEKENRKQSALLKNEEISQFLVLALMSESTKVISASMDVFEVLLSTRRNHPALQKLAYFMPTLERIAKHKQKYPVEIRRDAHNMLRVLNESKQPLCDQSAPMRNAENMSKGPAKTATFTRAKQRGRECILQVAPGVLQQDQNRVMIERTLIKVKGIISLTFNLPKNQCVIRGKHNVTSEAFGLAVANLGFEVFLVYKNLQEDVLVPVSSNEKELSKENLPDYLPEEDYENTSVADNAVCKQNSQAENPRQASIFDSAFSFVRSSFYW